MPEPLCMKDTKTANSTFRSVDLSRSVFDGVNLSMVLSKEHQ